MMRRCFAFPLGLLALISTSASPAWAIDPNCRVVEVRFTPQGFPARSGREALSPQISVWVEHPDGKHLADLYVTRSVGLLGLGNRPGAALLKGDFRWPYGRRPMTLPVWAYRRGKQYGYVVMGGKCSTRYNPNNPADTTCPNDFNGSPADDDTTVAYHGPVSSTEPYFCSPSGWRTVKQGGVDVVTCASSFFGSKGWYAPGLTSPYPPRADLSALGGNDHANVSRFAADNDVAAISAATPPSGQPVDPIRWYTTSDTPDGNYVMWVEVSIESDFNSFWTAGKAMPEPHSEWNHLGKDFLGQPSIVYKVPFLLDKSGRVATISDYSGYGDWRGLSGTINPPDGTISQSGGSGADRLAMTSDDAGNWRVKVSVAACDPQSCDMPAAPSSLDLSESSDATLTVKFTVPPGPPAAAYEVRYQAGMPITTDNFNNALPGPSTNLGPPGGTVSSLLTQLAPKTKYYVAVRPKSRCGQPGAITAGEGETGAAHFVTLSGCFVATAAYGSEMASEVDALRQLRDERLLKNPLGQFAVATYYAVSPGLATVVAQNEGLRALARRALAPIVGAARMLAQSGSSAAH